MITFLIVVQVCLVIGLVVSTVATIYSSIEDEGVAMTIHGILTVVCALGLLLAAQEHAVHEQLIYNGLAGYNPTNQTYTLFLKKIPPSQTQTSR